MTDPVSKEEILDFWFSPEMKKAWFNSTEALDKKIRSQYETTWKAAIRGDYDEWKDSAEGCLALSILFDQMPLNMFRGEVKSFSTEAMAIRVAKHAIDKGFDRYIDKDRLAFLYMPLMHSEKIADQELSVALFEKAGLEENLRFAKHHRDLIKKFGRFPHRNKILQRESTAEEKAYLNSKQAFTG